jgi:hypothetical protein
MDIVSVDWKCRCVEVRVIWWYHLTWQVNNNMLFGSDLYLLTQSSRTNLHINQCTLIVGSVNWTLHWIYIELVYTCILFNILIFILILYLSLHFRNQFYFWTVSEYSQIGFTSLKEISLKSLPQKSGHSDQAYYGRTLSVHVSYCSCGLRGQLCYSQKLRQDWLNTQS